MNESLTHADKPADIITLSADLSKIFEDILKRSTDASDRQNMDKAGYDASLYILLTDRGVGQHLCLPFADALIALNDAYQHHILLQQQWAQMSDAQSQLREAGGIAQRVLILQEDIHRRALASRPTEVLENQLAEIWPEACKSQRNTHAAATLRDTVWDAENMFYDAFRNYKEAASIFRTRAPHVLQRASLPDIDSTTESN